MDSEKKLTLNYLREMFNGTFDEDIIESVLEQRHWNSKNMRKYSVYFYGRNSTNWLISARLSRRTMSERLFQRRYIPL